MKAYWHIHHDALLEFATEPIENRVAYIKHSKPKNEIALRLGLLKPVKGTLPANLDKAWAARAKARDAYTKAGDAYDKAWGAHTKAWDTYTKAGDAHAKARDAYAKAGDAYTKAWDAYTKAWDACRLKIEALHKKECKRCPWDGKTIFPAKAK